MEEGNTYRQTYKVSSLCDCVVRFDKRSEHHSSSIDHRVVRLVCKITYNYY
jgi:hypothetical protein